MPLLKLLKTQIAAALLLIMLLFYSIFSLSIMALNEQQSYNTLLNITSRLEHTARNLVSLGVNYSYALYTPRENPLQGQDIPLYYQAIQEQMAALDMITMSFMTESFDPSMTQMGVTFHPEFSSDTQQAILAVEEIWGRLRSGIHQALGSNPATPRLNQAALYIANYNAPLVASIDVLLTKIRQQTESRLQQVFQLHRFILVAVVLITLGVFSWFYLVVLRPLGTTARAFNKVAQGDFGFQVPISSDNELAQMTHAFNQLSSRLHSIFRLIDRLQQGSDLDETLGFVTTEFPQLLPLDWVGALFVAADNRTIVLERSYRNGQPEIASRNRFQLDQTLLLKAIQSGEPLHIPNMINTAGNNPGFEFLNYLIKEGMQDAIFLPVTEQSPIPSVLAFATCKADSYSREHLELLTNIAGLVTHSFSRTVSLAEHARLAAIGSFASGIAHEIRSPLSTISMALDYFRRSDLPEPVSKRAELAFDEAGRMTRLLEEILLYAKPLQLRMEQFDLLPFLQQFFTTYQELPKQRQQRFELTFDDNELLIQGDRDKLLQTFLNLARNACEAAPKGESIDWRASKEISTRSVIICVSNGGETIAEEQLERLFDPFFTTKATGTGLGLGIVKRIVDAHGGDIHIESSFNRTTVQLRLPLASG